MRIKNPNIAKLQPGDEIEVRPCMYDRDWTPAIVQSVRYDDIPLKHDRCTTLLRRHEVFAQLVERPGYTPLIIDDNDVRLKQI